MFETVLVADRGATARRVVRTCQRLGARTVVVHAADDGWAPAVRVADEAVPLGGRGWAESYGDPRRVLEAARRTGAQAVHPGAGPLAEDAALARAVLDDGLVWLGVRPEALEGPPTAELARSLGLRPSGGGGRRLVATTLHTDAASTVLGLREQLPADGVPLVDRAPADVGDDVRSRCEHAALVIARAAAAGPLTAVGLTVDGGDVGVAAVLPALQPGCSATEAATGLDLVELQLRLAAGEQPRLDGARACALALHLRVVDRFAGRLRRWSVPARDELEDVRVDAAVGEGDRVQVGGERTLAVVTVRAPDHVGLLARAWTALDGVVVEGVPTALPALRAVLADL